MDTMGVGTEQIESSLQVELPEAPIIRFDRDSVSTPRQWQKQLDQVRLGKPCVIVGTQMLAKGHDLPNLTLVAIVGVDEGLLSIDFRASERLAQLVVQVAGRAGRSRKAGSSRTCRISKIRVAGIFASRRSARIASPSQDAVIVAISA